MKQLSLFALLVLLNSSAFTQENEIQFLTEPAKSRGFLVWTKAPNAVYNIQIFEKKPDANGVLEKRLLLSQTLRNNFYHFSDEYLIKDFIYYQVQVLNGLGKVLYETEELPAGDNAGYMTFGWWTCLSQLYAYSIYMELPTDSQGNGFLRVDNAFHQSSPNAFGTSMPVPYYEAMSPTVFNARMDVNNYYYSGIYAPPSFQSSRASKHLVVSTNRRTAFRKHY
jgi:hypothetical protein